MADNEKAAQETFLKFQNIVSKFLDANLFFAGGIPRTKKIQNAIIKKLPVACPASFNSPCNKWFGIDNKVAMFEVKFPVPFFIGSGSLL